MAGGDGALFRSSKGRWKRLFHFSGDVGKLKSVPEAAGEKAGAEESPGKDGAPLAEPKPLRSILAVPGQTGANRSPKRKLTWLHGLVDQEIEPTFHEDDDRRNSDFQRSAKRKSTGIGMETKDEKGTEKPEETLEQPASGEPREKPREPPLDEAAALKKQDHKKNSDDDGSGSEAFSESDDEFDHLEDLAEKNMRINKAATKISPAEIEANAMDLPLGPLTPLGNNAPTKAAKSDCSSFGASSDGEQAPAPKVVEHEGTAASAFTALPAGSACAAVKQLRKQDSKSSLGGSSFGSSDDDK